MHHLTLNLKITMTSKWHIGSGEGSLAVNRLVQRDSQNRPFIPASALKGVIRESCEKLSRTLKFPDPSDPHQTDLTIQDHFRPLAQLRSPVDRIFGNKFESGELFFRDARLENDPPYHFQKNQTRICSYRQLGTAKDKHLFSSEYIVPMTFLTSIDGYHRDLISIVEEDPPFEYCLLIAGIMNVGYLGGDKSTGNGRTDIQIEAMTYNTRNITMATLFEYLEMSEDFKNELSMEEKS
jgi:CRISPR-associated protein Csx10